MKHILLFAFLWFSFSSRASICDCPNDYAFCYTANDLPNDLVVTGVITAAQDTTNVQLRILETFKGTEANDTITVWAGTGIDCLGTWISEATHHIGSVGDTVIIILERITPNNLQNNWDVAGDYRRLTANCYHPWLQVSNGLVTGRIMGSYMFGPPPWSLTSMTYAEFQASWTGESMHCPITLAAEEETGLDIISLMPNPAAETVTVNWGKEGTGHATVQVHDLSGKLILSQTGFQNRGAFPVAQLANGVYVLRLVSAAGKQWQQKLVVQR